jgi:head-tail adaptor
MNHRDKLRVLLAHWMDHVREHADEFHLWAQEAGASGDERIASHLEGAAQEMRIANSRLLAALEALSKEPSA